MYYNVKMRAEKDRRHISGAERIVGKEGVQSALSALAQRAMDHPNGAPDAISLTVNRIDGAPLTLPALPVVEAKSRNPRDPEDARRLLAEELTRMRLDDSAILKIFYSLQGMRGAALLHAHTLERMEPDPSRGVRATCLDYTGNTGGGKRHLQEALCLASKVAACPFIAGELCMSDDPDYTTGYFASQERGYLRLPGIKEKGDPRGGRIFLFTGGRDDVAQCLHYLEHTPVLVIV